MKTTLKISMWLLAAGLLTVTSCKKDEDDDDTTPTPVTPTVSLPQSSNQVLYLPLNGSANASVGSPTVVSNSATWTADRAGNANSAANFAGASAPGNGQIIEYSNASNINGSTTISFWYKIDNSTFGPGSRFVFGSSVERGYFFELAGDQAWMKFATSHAVDPSGTPDHFFGTAWTDYMNGGSPVGGQLLFNYNNAGGTGMKPLLENSNWHQVVITYDSATSLKTVFLDGTKIMQADIDLGTTEWLLKDLAINNMNDDGSSVAGINSNLTLGYACSPSNSATGWADYATSTNTFQGALDDFRIWNIALSESEVATLYDFEN